MRAMWQAQSGVADGSADEVNEFWVKIVSCDIKNKINTATRAQIGEVDSRQVVISARKVRQAYILLSILKI